MYDSICSLFLTRIDIMNVPDSDHSLKSKLYPEYKNFDANPLKYHDHHSLNFSDISRMNKFSVTSGGNFQMQPGMHHQQHLHHHFQVQQQQQQQQHMMMGKPATSYAPAEIPNYFDRNSIDMNNIGIILTGRTNIYISNKTNII